MVNGKETAELLNRWQNMGKPLDDKELQTLINGLQVVFDFCSGMKLSPMTVYYGSELESLKRCQQNRKER